MPEYEAYYNTPVFNDPKPCPNEDCVDGQVNIPYWNGEYWEDEQRCCPVCKGDNHI